LICEQAQVEELILGLESIDPHIIESLAMWSADTAANVNFSHHHYVESIDKNDLFLL
jgi:hypothetical protein